MDQYVIDLLISRACDILDNLAYADAQELSDNQEAWQEEYDKTQTVLEADG